MALDYQRVFWSDIRGNVRWRLMSPLQKLALLNLIACQHELGGALPNDSSALRNLAEIPFEDWPTVWCAPLVDWFEPVDGVPNGGAIAEPKTRRLTLVDVAARRVMSEAGHRGAEARWKGGQRGPHADPQSGPQCSPSPSPSPSPAPTPTPAPQKQKRAPRAPSDTEPWIAAVDELVPPKERPDWIEVCAAHAAHRRRWKHPKLQPDTWHERVKTWLPRGLAAFRQAVADSGEHGWQGLFQPKAGTAPAGTIQKGPNRGQPSARDLLLGTPPAATQNPVRETTARVVNP